MKLVIAVIKPFKLDAVREAVAEIGINGMTVFDVRGFGRQGGETEVYRGGADRVHFLPKLRLEIACADDMCSSVASTVAKAAQTGRLGDGKIFILDLMNVIRVRTGDIGADAI